MQLLAPVRNYERNSGIQDEDLTLKGHADVAGLREAGDMCMI